jgi:ligand-binding SRPBCC domain-containing protein
VPYSFAVESHLRAPAERVWDHASSWAGVNRELSPLVTLTHPPRMARLTPDMAAPGCPAVRAWVLLFGLVPIDFDDCRLTEFDQGRGFLEESRLLSMSKWRHHRRIIPAGVGCVVRDEVEMIPRWRPLGPLLAAAYRLAFEYRHRRLRRLFGAARG